MDTNAATLSTHQLSDPEDWTKLTDISSRRRIQNRIAQRNRRRKLKGSREEKERLSRTPELQQGIFGAHSRANSMNSIPTIHDQSTPLTIVQTPYLNASSSHQIPSNLSTDQLIFQDSLSVKDTKALLTQLDQAQLQLQEFLSEESTGFQLPTPRQSHDFSTPDNFWDLSLMNDLDQSSTLPHINAPHEDFFAVIPKDEDVIVRSRSNSAANKNDMFLTPHRTSTLNRDQMSLLDPRLPLYTPSQDYTLVTPSLTRSDSSDDLENTHGNTALHLAAQKGHLQIVRLLVETGVAIDATNEDGLSALHLATTANCLPVVKFLLEHGANCSLRTNDGQNTLHLAVDNGDVKLVQLLLNYMVDPDSRDGNGKTALHRAVTRGQEDIVREMLLKGVNSQAKVGDQTPAGDDLSFDWSGITV